MLPASQSTESDGGSQEVDRLLSLDDPVPRATVSPAQGSPRLLRSGASMPNLAASPPSSAQPSGSTSTAQPIDAGASSAKRTNDDDDPAPPKKKAKRTAAEAKPDVRSLATQVQSLGEQLRTFQETVNSAIAELAQTVSTSRALTQHDVSAIIDGRADALTARIDKVYQSHNALVRDTRDRLAGLDEQLPMNLDPALGDDVATLHAQMLARDTAIARLTERLDSIQANGLLPPPKPATFVHTARALPTSRGAPPTRQQRVPPPTTPARSTPVGANRERTGQDKGKGRAVPRRGAGGTAEMRFGPYHWHDNNPRLQFEGVISPVWLSRFKEAIAEVTLEDNRQYIRVFWVSNATAEAFLRRWASREVDYLDDVVGDIVQYADADDRDV